MTIPKTGVVLGTYNRMPLLVRSIESVRENAGIPVVFYVIDGGSVDGSREWAVSQHDVVLLGQRPPLSGATRAFNAGFALAIGDGCKYVHHTNDDAELVTPGSISSAVEIMEADPTIGCVAFEFDLRPGQLFEYVHGKVYSNFGVVRTAAGREVARAQGDPTGCMWWNECYRTYGGDSEFGCWLWKLGWRVVEGSGLRVHDKNHQDELRKLNQADNPERADSKLFWSRWEHANSIAPPFGQMVANWKGARVHLGCGDKRLSSPWINVDGILSPATDLVADAFELFRGIPAGTLEHVYTSHFVEHVYPDKLPELLQLIRGALAPSGKLTVATISLEGIFLNRFKTANNGSNWNAALYGETNSSSHPYAAHRQCFTRDILRGLVLSAGFSSERDWCLEEYPEFLGLNDYGNSCRLVTCFSEGMK